MSERQILPTKKIFHKFFNASNLLKGESLPSPFGVIAFVFLDYKTSDAPFGSLSEHLRKCGQMFPRGRGMVWREVVILDYF